MNSVSTKSSLTAGRRAVLDVMQRYFFCRIGNLEIRGGEPSFDSPPRVIQPVKMGADNGPASQLGNLDCELKRCITELFDYLERIDHGTVELIEVRFGLPVQLMIEQPLHWRSVHTEGR
jgi:hypothetical protein